MRSKLEIEKDIVLKDFDYIKQERKRFKQLAKYYERESNEQKELVKDG